MNALADIVTFANSLALEGRRGLEEVGSTGRGSSQMREAEFPGVEEKDGAGEERAHTLERAGWGLCGPGISPGTTRKRLGGVSL